MKRRFKSAAAQLLSEASTVHGAAALGGGGGGGGSGGGGSHMRTGFWAVFLLSNVAFTSYLVRVVEERFEKKIIYTQIDSTPKVSEVPFPSVMICNENLLSARELRNIEGILKTAGIDRMKRQRFFSALPLLVQRSLDTSAITEDLEDVMEIMRDHYYDIDDIMLEVHQKCENLLLYCSFNRVLHNCSQMFTIAKTPEGYCCAFNYGGAGDGISVEERDSPVSEEDFVGKRNFVSTGESGRISGLRVVFDVEPADYPPWAPARFYGVKVIFTDPNDYPETTMHTRHVSMGQHVAFKVSPFMYVSDRQLKRYQPAERNCWFQDELKVAFTARYSFESCCTECRMELYNKRCGCVPFYYPIDDREQKTRVCSFKDVRCLRNTTATPPDPEQTLYGCNCLPECSDKAYILKKDIHPLNELLLPRDFASNITITNLTSLSVYFAKPTCTLYKKTLIMDWNDLIAT